MNRDIERGTLFTGLVLMGIGVLFTLDRLHIANFHDLVRGYWPLIIVFFAVGKLLNGRVWSGLWLMTVGVWLQIAQLHLFGLSFSSSWPLLLIALGAGMIVRTIFETVRRHEY